MLIPTDPPPPIRQQEVSPKDRANLHADLGAGYYEHGQMDERDVLETVRAAQGAGIPIVIRVPGMERGFVNRSLEAGAAGIMLARTVGSAGRSSGECSRSGR